MLVREMVEALHGQRPLAYTTVMTVLENLHRKGWLRRERDGRAWRYEPTGSRSSYTSALMNDALATSSDRRTALAHFVLQMSPHDAALLRQALGQAQPEPESGNGRPSGGQVGDDGQQRRPGRPPGPADHRGPQDAQAGRVGQQRRGDGHRGSPVFGSPSACSSASRSSAASFGLICSAKCASAVRRAGLVASASFISAAV